MHGDMLKKEIQLADNECCIVFDFGCYFPYSNAEILRFDFALGEEKFDDYKINHRYSNKHYQTISKIYGRKISKLGYPYVMKLDEQTPMLLCLKVGIKEQYITAIFPLQTDMTKDKNICALSLLYIFDENKFRFVSYEKSENSGWYQHNWYSHEAESDRKCDNDILLNTPYRLGEDSYTLIYDNVITPYSQLLSDFMIF